MERKEKCHRCNGSGKVDNPFFPDQDDSPEKTCDSCNGTGEKEGKCPLCDGEGTILDQRKQVCQCYKCHGTGKKKDESKGEVVSSGIPNTFTESRMNDTREVKPSGEGVGANIPKEVIEQLADIEHQRWADWQAYLHSCLNINNQIPIDKFNRWHRQILTKYCDLSEQEKQSDRNEVKRYLPIIQSLLTARETAAVKDERERVCNKAVGEIEKHIEDWKRNHRNWRDIQVGLVEAKVIIDAIRKGGSYGK